MCYSKDIYVFGYSLHSYSKSITEVATNIHAFLYKQRSINTQRILEKTTEYESYEFAKVNAVALI